MSQLAYLTCVSLAEYELLIFLLPVGTFSLSSCTHDMRKALPLLSVARYSNEAKLKAAALHLRSLRKGQISFVSRQLVLKVGYPVGY